MTRELSCYMGNLRSMPMGSKPLTNFKKQKLIETIAKMVFEEERLGNDVHQAVTYPLFTPLDQEKAAAQLQQFLTQQRN